MAGGFTQIPKLKTDLGTEGTGDRIGLFNSGGELVGYMLKGTGFLPLSGGNLTGEVFSDSNFSFNDINDDPFIKFGFDPTDDRAGLFYESGISDEKSGLYPTNSGIEMFAKSTTKGLFSIEFFAKQNDPNAFAQLGDIAEENKTLVPLSLLDLNTEYPTQPTGFQVICKAISLIYIKSSLDEWQSIATTTVV